jgi:hypothetical protein
MPCNPNVLLSPSSLRHASEQPNIKQGKSSESLRLWGAALRR